MAKLRHLAITVPGPEKAAEFCMRAFGMQRVGATDWENARGVYLIEAAGGTHWMGEAYESPSATGLPATERTSSSAMPGLTPAAQLFPASLARFGELR